ncbi:lipopolysaccharide biosynthesis protein [Oscillatoriales cyanobacterium USR001]|nr:lipopolysaccharide biosynthesis protein [Oscillatoriales cyanobacterium USR001]
MKPEINSQLTSFTPNQSQLGQTKLNTAFYPDELQDRAEKTEERVSIWDVFRRRFLLIMGVTAATTTAAFSLTLNQVNEYEGKFQLLVEPMVNDNILAKIYSGEVKLETANLENSSFDYNSQIEVLQSPKIMLPIIKQVQSQYPEVNYKELFEKTTGNSQFGSDKLSIQRLNNTKILEVRYRDIDPNKIQFVLDKVAQGYRNYSLQDGKTDIRKTVDFIQSQILQQRKKINDAQADLQKLRQQYNFIDPQIQTQQLAQQTSQIEAQRLENQTQINQQELLYTRLQGQLGLDQNQALMASALTQAPRYQALLNQLQQLEANIAINSATYTAESPQLQSLMEQHKNLLPLLRREAEKVLGTDLAKVQPQVLAFQDSVRMKLIEELVNTANQIQVLGVRDRVLEQAAKQLNEYAQAFPVVLRRYSDLQREVEISNSTLNNLLAKQQSLQLESLGVKDVAWEAIAKPEIPRYKDGKLIPVSPNMPLNLAFGGMAGLLLGMLLAQLVERFKHKVFHTPAEVKYSLRLPLLGVIPVSDRGLKLSPAKDKTAIDVVNSPLPTTAFQEAFRLLNANIKLLSVDSPIRAFAITSCQVADGKSTVAVNLAMAAAAMGQRVLLVDADLRRPQVHEMLSLPNWKGLSSIISEDLAVEEAMVRSPEDENLFVLTSGPFFPDPTKLLSSRKMQYLMESLLTKFDLIIYDTPPLFGLADANLLAAHTNGLMLVVGLNQTEREAIILALEDLKMAGIPLLGVVANGDKGSRYYYQSYIANYVEQKST